MTSPLALRGKWTFRARGRQVVLAKKSDERETHVLLKAFLWALYLPAYPDLQVEMPAGGRYKPDLVQFDAGGAPVFWGEAGVVGERKLRDLARRRGLHIVLAKWNARLDPFDRMIHRAIRGVNRRAPLELIGFPEDAAEAFLDGRDIRIDPNRLEWRRF
jgi:hypothetical protein